MRFGGGFGLRSVRSVCFCGGVFFGRVPKGPCGAISRREMTGRVGTDLLLTPFEIEGHPSEQ